MKSIRCWDDLSPFGIVPLTGEACGLSYRILCDVTAAGKEDPGKGIRRCPVGAPRELESRQPRRPPRRLRHVGTRLAHLHRRVRPVGKRLSRGLADQESASHRPQCRRPRRNKTASLNRYCGDELVMFGFAYAGTAGDRNQHMMSGRIH